jgi:hypothetical protein
MLCGHFSPKDKKAAIADWRGLKPTIEGARELIAR